MAKRKVHGIYIGGKPKGRSRMVQCWVATYIAPWGEGYCMDNPPGDCYSEWGWQEDTVLPASVRRSFTNWIESGKWAKDKTKTLRGYTCVPWDQEEEDEA